MPSLYYEFSSTFLLKIYLKLFSEVANFWFHNPYVQINPSVILLNRDYWNVPVS